MNNNTLVVGIFAGCMLGFILAMLAGVFGVGTIQSVPAWLQGAFSGFAAIVSVYAVFLVAQTLKATQDALKITQDTLDATRAMAEDQRKIGDAQTRAWILLNGWNEASTDKSSLSAVVVFKNFGNTPALEETILPIIETYTTSSDSDHIPNTVQYEELTETRLRSFPPGAKISTHQIAFTECRPDDELMQLVFRIEYRTIHDPQMVIETVKFDLEPFDQSLTVSLA